MTKEEGLQKSQKIDDVFYERPHGPFLKKSENILISWINDEKNPDSVRAAKHNDNLSFKNFIENDSLTNSR